MPEYTVDDQIATLSPEQKQQIIAQLEQIKRDNPASKQNILSTVSGGLLRGARGALLASQGQPISGLPPIENKDSQYEALLKQEQLKNLSDPTRQKAQMELEELQRLKAEQTGGQPQAGGQTQAVPGQELNQATPIQDAADVPEMFIEVPKGKNKYGIMEYETKENPAYKRWEDEKKEFLKQKVKSEAKAGEASNKALGNFGRIASAIKLYADYYGAALKEGGVGTLHGKYIGQAKLKMGGDLGDTVTETGKLYGQGVEMSLASIPIMTGQNRFVESLRQAIKGTYPQGQEGPKLAASLLEQTLVNMYMTSKVLSRLGIDIEEPTAGDNLSDEDTVQILQEAGYNPQSGKWSASNIYKLDDSEKKELEAVKKDILGGLTGGGEQKKGGASVIKGMFDDLLTNPQGGV